MKVGMYREFIAIETCDTVIDEYYEFTLTEAIDHTISISHPEDLRQTLTELKEELLKAIDYIQKQL